MLTEMLQLSMVRVGQSGDFNMIRALIVGMVQNLWAIEFDRSLMGERRQMILQDMENLCHLDWDRDFEDKATWQFRMYRVFGIEWVDCTSLMN